MNTYAWRVRMCLTRQSLLMKLWLQIEQTLGSSMMWVRSWIFNAALDANNLPQWLQEKSENKSIVHQLFLCKSSSKICHSLFSSLCVSRWRFRSSFRMNDFEQTSHVSGASFWCTKRMCSSKRAFRLNTASHWSQLNPFSPVWLNMCARSWVAWMNFFPQMVHSCGLSPDGIKVEIEIENDVLIWDDKTLERSVQRSSKKLQSV